MTRLSPFSTGRTQLDTLSSPCVLAQEKVVAWRVVSCWLDWHETTLHNISRHDMLKLMSAWTGTDSERKLMAEFLVFKMTINISLSCLWHFIINVKKKDFSRTSPQGQGLNVQWQRQDLKWVLKDSLRTRARTNSHPCKHCALGGTRTDWHFLISPTLSLQSQISGQVYYLFSLCRPTPD